jgi:hypothetical protein
MLILSVEAEVAAGDEKQRRAQGQSLDLQRSSQRQQQLAELLSKTPCAAASGAHMTSQQR